MSRSVMLLVMLFFSTQIFAKQIYKWVDEKGQIHYSEKKPAGQEAEAMKIKKAPKFVAKDEPETATDNATDSSSADDEAVDEAEAKAKSEAAAQLAAADKVNKRKECDQARTNLTALNATVRVTRANADGEIVRMTDDERVSALQNAQKAIKQYCQ